MPKQQEEPLNEVSLNMPAGKSSASICYPKLRCDKENANNVVDIYQWLDKISCLLKDRRSVMRHKAELSDEFSAMYQLVKMGQMVTPWKILIRNHLMFVVNLFNCDDFRAAQEEILHLYNESDPFPVANIRQLLLADFTFCNIGHLSTLKILAMQAILKLKSCGDYQQTLLQLFSHDERYLLQGSNVKIHTIIKLLLNFYSTSVSYKVIFGLKFIQYVNQYNLKIGDYIKNMSILSFERQLYRYVPKEHLFDYGLYLGSVYFQYTKYRKTPEKVMLSDIFSYYKQRMSLENVLQFKDGENEQQRQELLTFRTEDLTRIMDIPLGDLEQPKMLQSLHNVWFILRHDSSRRIKYKNIFCDRTLVFINSNLAKLTGTEDGIASLLETLYEYCIDNQESQRLTNVINTSFNCFVVLKQYDFLKSAARMEVSRYYLFKDPKLIRPILKKFEKFLSCSLTSTQMSEIFSFVFNVNFTLNEVSLASLQEFCQIAFKYAFSVLKPHNYVNFPNCSEVMLALLYSNVSAIHVPLESWSPITQMLYSCCSGVFNLNSAEIINSHCNKGHVLQGYEVLIKTAYCFNIEMSKHSTLNLALITKRYMDKWVSRIRPSLDTISSFEVEMLSILLYYLKFSNLDKILLDLIDLLKTKKDFYGCLTRDMELQKYSALLDLRMTNDLKLMGKEVSSSTLDFNLNFEQLLTALHLRLKISVWEENKVKFDKIFVQTLPLRRPELLDIENNSKLPTSRYLKVLLFNIDLLGGASRVHISSGRMIEATIEAKKALKLSVCLLKKIDKISQGSRLKLISSVAFAYRNLIKAYIHLGIARDCEYYVKEFSKIICDLREPSAVFMSLHFLHQYYLLTGQIELAATVLKKENRTFDFIDGESNILGLTVFLHDNGEDKKISHCLKMFFGKTLPKTFLLRYWGLKIGYTINISECPPKYNGRNNINRIASLYDRIVHQLESDPFFKGMFDALIAVPSCQHLTKDGAIFPRSSDNNSSKSNICSSPRSSAMTPRGKHLKPKFDRITAISNLESLKNIIEGTDLASLRNYEVSRLATFYSLTLSLLSSICPHKVTEKNLTDRLVLSDLSKSLPLIYDNFLNAIHNDLYSHFNLLSTNEFPISISTERQKLLQLQESFAKCKQPFNVISIDLCPINGNLLITKLISNTRKMMYLRVPLDRTYTRDLDSYKMTFHEARDELISIVQESTETISVEVTSTIKTKEERRAWWETRYELDRRLEILMANIERYWFNGLKGMFCPKIINARILDEFRMKVNDILHQNLPSRKQFGNPSMFAQMDDWIIELMLKLNPQDNHFAFMVEDLLYFVLDILLFQGEENAYDEIDFGLIHVQLEEQIRKFRARIYEGEDEKVDHTFLVVSSECHLFPWERLPFMNSLSISRIPSFGYLDDIMRRFNYNLFPPVSLSDKISMVLNPHGDLRATEKRFSPQFSKIVAERKDSTLIVNSKPDESVFLQMLIYSNLFVYLGHGGGEQYARIKEIKKCNNIAPSFLLGCSSAAMKYLKNLEPTGTAYAYLMGGCPLVLGNLWDVTDKDIDKFSEMVFNKINFFEDEDNGDDSSIGETLTAAVSSSRDVCHLKYLNGAAPVIYGLPVKFFNHL